MRSNAARGRQAPRVPHGAVHQQIVFVARLEAEGARHAAHVADRVRVARRHVVAGTRRVFGLGRRVRRIISAVPEGPGIKKIKLISLR